MGQNICFIVFKFNYRDTQANLIETEVDLIEVYVGHGACVEFPLTNRQPLANFNGNLNADNHLWKVISIFELLAFIPIPQGE